MKKFSDIIPKSILLLTCFVMWGLSSNMTDPLVCFIVIASCALFSRKIAPDEMPG